MVSQCGNSTLKKKLHINLRACVRGRAWVCVGVCVGVCVRLHSRRLRCMLASQVYTRLAALLCIRVCKALVYLTSANC